MFAIKAFIILLGTDYLVLLFGNVYLGIQFLERNSWGIFISEKVLGDTLFGYPYLCRKGVLVWGL